MKKKIKYFFITFIFIIVVFIIGKNRNTSNSNNKSNTVSENIETTNSLKEEPTCESLYEEPTDLNISRKSDIIEYATISSDSVDFGDDVGIIYYYSLTDSYDIDSDESLMRGMCDRVENALDEESFLSYFFEDLENVDIVYYGDGQVYMGKNGNERKIVFFSAYSVDTDYPKLAYGFKYNLSDLEPYGSYDITKEGEDIFDYIVTNDPDKQYLVELMKPLPPNINTEYSLVGDNITKVDYVTNKPKSGTYNSSGTLFLDQEGTALNRYFIISSGEELVYYLYNEEGKLVQYIDFGGMAYKELPDNKEIDIGVPFEIYYFD